MKVKKNKKIRQEPHNTAAGGQAIPRKLPPLLCLVFHHSKFKIPNSPPVRPNQAKSSNSLNHRTKAFFCHASTNM
jgi:hypothetical protein